MSLRPASSRVAVTTKDISDLTAGEVPGEELVGHGDHVTTSAGQTVTEYREAVTLK